MLVFFSPNERVTCFNFSSLKILDHGIDASKWGLSWTGKQEKSQSALLKNPEFFFSEPVSEKHLCPLEEIAVGLVAPIDAVVDAVAELVDSKAPRVPI